MFAVLFRDFDKVESHPGDSIPLPKIIQVRPDQLAFHLDRSLRGLDNHPVVIAMPKSLGAVDKYSFDRDVFRFSFNRPVFGYDRHGPSDCDSRMFPFLNFVRQLSFLLFPGNDLVPAPGNLQSINHVEVSNSDNSLE